MKEDLYLHGTHPEEQGRLALLNRILNDACLKDLELEGNEKILDVGSGLGIFSLEMAQTGASVVGVERDENQLRAARELCEGQGSKMPEFRQGNAYALPLNPLEEGSFDLVYCRFVLEHLADPQRAVDQMATAVSKSGRIYLLDDDHSLLRLYPDCPDFEQLWKCYYQSYRGLGNDPLVGRRLPSLLVNAGCEVIRTGSLFFGSWHSDPNFRHYIDNLKGIILGAIEAIESQGLMGREEVLRAIRTFEEWSKDREASLWYTINLAEAKKK